MVNPGSNLTGEIQPIDMKLILPLLLALTECSSDRLKETDKLFVRQLTFASMDVKDSVVFIANGKNYNKALSLIQTCKEIFVAKLPSNSDVIICQEFVDSSESLMDNVNSVQNLSIREPVI